MLYTIDFETNTSEESCKSNPVWAVGICEVRNYKNFYYGNSLEWAIDFFKQHGGDIFYFHNLKFDGEFVISYLLKHGFKHVTKRKGMKRKEFTTLISDRGQFYSIEVVFENGEKVLIYDSLKLIPFKVEEIASKFGLPISKLEIDYKKERKAGHELTREEVDYLRNDVEIMSRALNILFDMEINSMTLGSSALKEYKSIIGAKKFKKLFPPLEYYVDQDIRQAYKGGFTYCDPRTQGQDVGEGIVLDVNSLYPSVMYYCELPYGEPIYFDGEYKPDKIYKLYVFTMKCQFELKDGKIPTLQLKNNLAFIPTEYLESSGDEEVTITMTSVDYELFKEHYEIYNPEFIGGWKFKSTKGLFKDYIDKWTKIKIEATITKNKGLRQTAKLMLNNLYGKFATNPNVQSKIPYLNDEGIVKYRYGEKEQRDTVYLPVACFVTAWARYKTITSAQKCYDRFCYADTDSLHLIGKEIPEELEISDTELGKWALEGEFTRARFLRQKSYIEEIDGKLNITCAGMPAKCYQGVTWDNFKIGNTFEGKLQQYHVDGGIILKDTTFTIKE